MNITKGKVSKPKKVVIYGPEGIGKSTFASHFPDPLFIDTEGSTNELDVMRMDKPASWEMLKGQINFVIINKPCRTLIIDTIDWAENLCITAVCNAHDKKGIEDFGYGNGYVYEKEEFGRFLNLLEEVINAGINVVLTAHAAVRKFEQPDELGAYDRWELKLGKKTTSLIAPIVKEWADMVLFANYKTMSVATDKDGKKHKAQGGRRIMYTSHHPCWDAKTRYGLPEEIPMDYEQIRHIIERPAPVPQAVVQQAPVQTAEPIQPSILPAAEPITPPPPPPAPLPISISDGIPKALADLMTANNVTEEQIRKVVSDKGHLPYDLPVSQYPRDYVDGVLIACWGDVYKAIEELYPF